MKSRGSGISILDVPSCENKIPDFNLEYSKFRSAFSVPCLWDECKYASFSPLCMRSHLKSKTNLEMICTIDSGVRLYIKVKLIQPTSRQILENANGRIAISRSKFRRPNRSYKKGTKIKAHDLIFNILKSNKKLFKICDRIQSHKL